MGELAPSTRPLETVDIARLVPADWNYKDEGDRKDIEKLKRSILRDGSAGVPAVRELDALKLEVMDGNHRLIALVELGFKMIVVENFGKITKAAAIVIARRRNKPWFREDMVKLAKLFKEEVVPEIAIDELKEFMQDDIDRLLGLADFDWAQYGDAPGPSEGEKGGTVRARLGPEDFAEWSRAKSEAGVKTDEEMILHLLDNGDG